MSNTARDYKERQAGYSPEHLRDRVKLVTENKWSGTAIDVGTGSGEFARILLDSKKFNRVIGVDLCDKRTDENKVIELMLKDLAKEQLELSDASTNAIFALEVIEHLENPRYFVREMFRILRPGGILVLTTPSVESLRARLAYLFRGYFPPFCDHDYRVSGHITPITSLDLKRMGNETGYTKVEVDFNFPGFMPKLHMAWHQVFPFLKGKLWSDSMMAVLTK